MIRLSRPEHLERVLAWFVRRTFDDLMVPYEPSGPYLADVLLRLSRTDSLYRIRSLDGNVLHQVAEILLERERERIRPPAAGSEMASRQLVPLGQIILPKGENEEDGATDPGQATPDRSPLTEAEDLLFRRHLGDFALFLAGLFRSQLDRRGCLDLYTREGVRAYRHLASTFEDKAPSRQRLFCDLSDHFERYTDALDYMGKVYLHGREGKGEGFHRFQAALDAEVFEEEGAEG
jgi:hypothetical protein